VTAGRRPDREPAVPAGIDVTRPSIARIWDYLLGGKDNISQVLL
jgi:hypothetical protein